MLMLWSHLRNTRCNWLSICELAQKWLWFWNPVNFFGVFFHIVENYVVFLEQNVVLFLCKPFHTIFICNCCRISAFYLVFCSQFETGDHFLDSKRLFHFVQSIIYYCFSFNWNFCLFGGCFVGEQKGVDYFFVFFTFSKIKDAAGLFIWFALFVIFLFFGWSISLRFFMK